MKQAIVVLWRLTNRPVKLAALLTLGLAIVGIAFGLHRSKVERLRYLEAQAAIRHICSTYSIEITTSITPSSPSIRKRSIEADEPSIDTLANYAPLLERELFIYPVDFVRRMQIKRIVLCENLKFADRPVSGLADFEDCTVFLDITYESVNARYLSKAIHHELFHIVDYVDDGQIETDECWSNLNSSDFRYLGDRILAKDSKRGLVLTDETPGFLNSYSTTAVEEDKAEVFANMIVEPRYVARRTEGDFVVRAKVTRMRSLLKTFCPELDDQFWRKVADLKRE